MFGYGVASRSMAYYPDPYRFAKINTTTTFDGRSIFRQIVYPVYYFMYGNVGTELSNFDGKYKSSRRFCIHHYEERFSA